MVDAVARALIAVLVAFLAGCGDGCDEIDFLAAIFDTEPHDQSCEESYDPTPRDDGIRPGLLIARHIVSGDVLAIRDEYSGSGETLHQPVAVELAPSGDSAYIADGAAILQVAIPSGATTIVSNASHGSGPDFANPVCLEWEPGTGRLLVHDAGLDAVIAVDPATGSRSGTLIPFSPASVEEERRVRDDSIGVEYIVFRETE